MKAAPCINADSCEIRCLVAGWNKTSNQLTACLVARCTEGLSFVACFAFKALLICVKSVSKPVIQIVCGCQLLKRSPVCSHTVFLCIIRRIKAVLAVIAVESYG